jgi:hypothetical protein
MRRLDRERWRRAIEIASYINNIDNIIIDIEIKIDNAAATKNATANKLDNLLTTMLNAIAADHAAAAADPHNNNKYVDIIAAAFPQHDPIHDTNFYNNIAAAFADYDHLLFDDDDDIFTHNIDMPHNIEDIFNHDMHIDDDTFNHLQEICTLTH